MSLPTDFVICIISRSNLIFILLGHIFLFLCVPGKVGMGARHCGFPFIGYWVFVFLLWCCRTLFWSSSGPSEALPGRHGAAYPGAASYPHRGSALLHAQPGVLWERNVFHSACWALDIPSNCFRWCVLHAEPSPHCSSQRWPEVCSHKTVISCILSFVFNCFVWEGKSGPSHPEQEST